MRNMQNPKEGDFFFSNVQFLGFVNFDMFTTHILRNCYEKNGIYILANLKQVVTVGVNQMYCFVLRVSH